MMIFVTFWDVVLFAVTVFAGGAACAPRVAVPAVLRLGTGVTIVLAAMFFAGFAAYIAGLPNRAAAVAVAILGVVVVAARRGSMIELLREPDVRRFLGAWLMLAGWSIGLLALILTYSGGTWAGDWLEHWQRTRFFFEHQPPETRFIGLYSLTARPPLANAVIALWLEATGKSFADFQVFMALLGSLVLLPAWRLAHRWSTSPQVGRWLTLVCMLSPFLVQNLTFAWTKLPTAFFVLHALAIGREVRGDARMWGAVSLGLAVLTHYSAVPWLVAIGAATWYSERASWRQGRFWREQLCSVLIIVLLCAPWVGWSIARFGWNEAAGSTSSAAAWRQQSSLERIRVPLENIYGTIVPHFLRAEPGDEIVFQESRLGRIRDLAFNFYQTNLIFALGFGGVWALASRLALRRSRPDQVHPREAKEPREFWFVLVPLSIVLGIAVHTPPEPRGLAHICLQPLLVVGLVWIAVTLASGSPKARAMWVALTCIDVSLGIVLHFVLQSCVLAPGRDIGAFLNTLNAGARSNALGKLEYGLSFLADRIGVASWLIAVWLAALLACASVRVCRNVLKSK